jgi:hypothetical protein
MSGNDVQRVLRWEHVRKILDFARISEVFVRISGHSALRLCGQGAEPDIIGGAEISRGTETLKTGKVGTGAGSGRIDE